MEKNRVGLFKLYLLPAVDEFMEQFTETLKWLMI